MKAKTIALSLGVLLLIAYVFGPFVAGLFPNVDRRGPKIFWAPHHELLCTIAHELMYNEKPRPYLSERGWFYGLEGKPYVWLDVQERIDKFELSVGEEELARFRQLIWSESQGPVRASVAKSLWPPSFEKGGAQDVYLDTNGVFIMTERGSQYEAGVFLLGTGTSQSEVENDPIFAAGYFRSNRIYRYYIGERYVKK